MEEYRHILVNKEHEYNEENYKDQELVKILIPIADREIIDEDIVTIDENGKKWAETYIEKDTYEKMLKLQEIVKAKYGINIKIIEALRTYAKQDHYFKDATDREGLEYAENYVAKPGHSEHHTGLAVDYAISSDKLNRISNPQLKKVAYKLSKPSIFYLVNKEAAELGLLNRYPLFSKKYTGYKHERWHITNIKNPALASFLFRNNLPLEKFYANPKKYAERYESFKENFYKKHPELLNDENSNDTPANEDNEMGM